MEDCLKFYINGEWVDPMSSETLDVINPATEEPIAKIALGSAGDIDKAVMAARGAFNSFSQTTKAERLELYGDRLRVHSRIQREVDPVIFHRRIQIFLHHR